MKKIAVLGLGKMGQNHLRILKMLRDVEIVGLFDTNRETLLKNCEQIDIEVPDSLESALSTADAVIICSPTSTHEDYIRRVAAAGVRHIFVEKPMVETLVGSEKICALAKELKLNMQVGFIERFNAAIVELKKILDSAEQVISVDFVRTNKLSARITDVDVVTDLMIHDIDLALYLNGPVTNVSAQGVVRNSMIEFAIATLAHKNGRFSRIQASRITEKKIRSIQATCTEKFVDCDLLRKEILIHKDSQTSQSNGGAYKISSMEEAVEVRPQEALLTELHTFIRSMDNPEEVKPDEYDGFFAMEVCDQIRKCILL